jgi:SAM-dependent methyltransferase
MTHQVPDCAEAFDLEHGQHDEDISFFITMAHEMGGPLMELGCGTGRLAIPLARSGMEVVGIDISADMLNRFSRSLAHEPAEVRNRIRLIQADMRRFVLNRRFSGVICSSNTLLLLGSEKAIGEALACIRWHLAPGGKILVDDGGTRAALMKYPREHVPDLAFTEKVWDDSLRRTHSVEPLADANAVSVRYRYLDSGGLRAERREDLVLLLPEELLRLMGEQGYEVLQTFGWYDRRRFCSTERKLLVVAENGSENGNGAPA